MRACHGYLLFPQFLSALLPPVRLTHLAAVLPDDPEPTMWAGLRSVNIRRLADRHDMLKCGDARYNSIHKYGV